MIRPFKECLYTALAAVAFLNQSVEAQASPCQIKVDSARKLLDNPKSALPSLLLLMNASLTKHPALIFGTWLKMARQKVGIIARVFAGQINLSPSKYAEVEVGVTKWMDEERIKLASEALDLSSEERQHMQKLFTEASAVPSLKFSDVFTREELAPIRCCSSQNRPLSEEESAELLDAVFAELK